MKTISRLLTGILIFVTLFSGIATTNGLAKKKKAKPVKLRQGLASAKRTKSKIKINGKLNEKSWEIKNKIKQDVHGISNNKASFGLLWNKKYLYVGVKVIDNKLVSDSGDLVNDDSVQIFFDMNNNHFYNYDIHDSFYHFGISDNKIWEKYNKVVGVKRAVKITKKGYNMEIAFPWKTILAKPKLRKMLGFDIGIIDDDDGDMLDSQKMWFGGKDNDMFAQNFGDFYLNNKKNSLKPPKHPKEKQPNLYHYKNYFEYIYKNDQNRIIRLWIPSKKKTVNGLIMLGNGGNGDWRYESSHRELQIFAKEYGYGVLSHKGIVGSRTYEENAAIIFDALRRFAKKGNKPELNNVPFIYSGSSSGGASAYGIMNYAPERTIAITSNVTAGFNPATPLDAALKVPAMFTTGENDGSFNGMRTMVEAARKRGAIWSWLGIQGMGHEHQRTYHMFLPFWAKAIEKRVPKDADPTKGPVVLNEIKEETGWLSNNSSWTTGCTEIASYDEYAGDKSEASWIIDKDIAYLYRGLSSWNQKLNTTITGNPALFEDPEYTLKIYKPDREIELNVETIDFPGKLTKVEYYKGSQLIGETSGESIKYKLESGQKAQTFTAIGYDEDNNKYASTIIGVIVR